MKSMGALCFWREKKKLLTHSTFLMPGSALINIIPNDITFPENSLESDLRAEPLSLRITNYCLSHFLLSWIKIIHLQLISRSIIVRGPRGKEHLSLVWPALGNPACPRGEKTGSPLPRPLSVWWLYLGKQSNSCPLRLRCSGPDPAFNQGKHTCVFQTSVTVLKWDGGREVSGVTWMPECQTPFRQRWLWQTRLGVGRPPHLCFLSNRFLFVGLFFTIHCKAQSPNSQCRGNTHLLNY